MYLLYAGDGCPSCPLAAARHWLVGSWFRRLWRRSSDTKRRSTNDCGALCRCSPQGKLLLRSTSQLQRPERQSSAKFSKARLWGTKCAKVCKSGFHAGLVESRVKVIIVSCIELTCTIPEDLYLFIVRDRNSGEVADSVIQFLQPHQTTQ